MRKVITITELLSKINKTRKDLDDVYMTYIDPNTSKNSRSMVSLYYPSSELSVNGIPVSDVTDSILSINDTIYLTIKNLQKLMMIKEQVNAICRLEVPSIFEDSTVELSIAQILMLRSKQLKNYIINYLDKLEDDYNNALTALDNHQSVVMNNDKIERYVLAKLHSLNLTSTQDVINANYESFAKEYSNANILKILDPLHIEETIRVKKKNIIDAYESIDVKLLEFNSSTKIWIDLDEEQNFWGFEKTK